MKNIIFTGLFFIGILQTAQSQKSEYILDEYGKKITLGEFKKKMETHEFLYTVYENDTAWIGKIAMKEEFGEMSVSERDDIIKVLELISKSDIDPKKNLIINFFYKPQVPVNGSCIDHYTSDNHFKREVKRNKITQFFITENNYKYGKNTFEDFNDQIRLKLFPFNFQCGNYIIIKPDGKFYRKVSEYRQDLIFDNLNRIQ